MEKEKKSLGRPAGQVANPKEIRKHFYVTDEMNNKIKKVSEHYGEFQAIILRRAVQEFIDRFERDHDII